MTWMQSLHDWETEGVEATWNIPPNGKLIDRPLLVENHIDNSDHEIVEFKIMSEMKKTNVITLDIWRTDFGLFCDLLGSGEQRTPGHRRACWISPENKIPLFICAGRWASVTEGQHGLTGNSWIISNTKNKSMKWGRRNGILGQNVKMVAKECRDEAEKTKKSHLKLGPVVNVKDKAKDFPEYKNAAKWRQRKITYVSFKYTNPSTGNF